MLETIQVVAAKSPENETGITVINKSDFDPEIHALVNGDVDSDAALTAAQLRDALTAAGITFPSGASKADLRALLVESKKSSD